MVGDINFLFLVGGGKLFKMVSDQSDYFEVRHFGSNFFFSQWEEGNVSQTGS